MKQQGCDPGCTSRSHMQPTVFHITHQKAGSQRVAEVLKYCALERFVQPKVGSAQFLQDSLLDGFVEGDRARAVPDFYLYRTLHRASPRLYAEAFTYLSNQYRVVESLLLESDAAKR